VAEASGKSEKGNEEQIMKSPSLEMAMAVRVG
jgi:hypothetical protein